MSADRTDLEKVKEIAESMLDWEIEVSEVCGVNMVSHPFWDNEVIVWRTPEGNLDGFSILDGPDGIERAKKRTKALIDDTNSAQGIFMLVTRKYRFLFFRLMENYLSHDDFSEMMSYIWTEGENTSRNNPFSTAQFVKMFKFCNPQNLMSESENEYYQNLPDELTIYRGLIEKNKTCEIVFPGH